MALCIHIITELKPPCVPSVSEVQFPTSLTQHKRYEHYKTTIIYHKIKGHLTSNIISHFDILLTINFGPNEFDIKFQLSKH